MTFEIILGLLDNESILFLETNIMIADNDLLIVNNDNVTFLIYYFCLISMVCYILV